MKKIKLIKPHIHAGVSYSPGDEILVTDADAQYLIQHQISVAITNAKPQAKAKTKAEKTAINTPPDTLAEQTISEDEGENHDEK